MSQNLNPTPTPKRLAAHLEATRDALAHAREQLKQAEATRAQARRSGGDVTRSERQVLTEKQADLEVTRASHAVFEAELAHKQALLASEVASGSADARAAANAVETLAAGARHLAELQAQLKTAERSYETLFADIRAAHDRLAASRAAAGELRPRHLPEGLARACRAAVVSDVLGVRQALTLDGATDIEAMLSGRAADDQKRAAFAHSERLKRVDVDRLRFSIYENETAEAAKRERATKEVAERNKQRKSDEQRKSTQSEAERSADARQREQLSRDIEAHFGGAA